MSCKLMSLLKYVFTSLGNWMARVLAKLWKRWRLLRGVTELSALEKQTLVTNARKDLSMLASPDLYNIAVVGQSGAGKSSLINGLRKIGDTDAASAKVGETETVPEIAKYVHPTIPQLALWELPGAGTLWQPSKPSYFETQKLYAFDCILVVVAERFTEVGFEVATKALEWGKPCVFVRTRADVGVRSIARRKKLTMEEASTELRKVVKESFEGNLKQYKLPSFKLLILSSWAFSDRAGPSPYVNGDDKTLKAMDEEAALSFLSSLRPPPPSSSSAAAATV